MEKSVEEKLEKSRKIPKGVPFILGNILLERYSTTGTTAILALYLNRKLNFDPNSSTAIFHTSELLAYLSPIFGAIIADSWWGHFKTILWMLFAFTIGSIILTVGSIEALNISAITFTFVGLLISVNGAGCTRAIITAFGGNQYELPEQAKPLQLFFSLQIFAIKCGSFLGRFFSPILKEDVKCFGANDCYPLAFGTAAIGVTVSLILFLCGRSYYIRKPTNGNMLVKVTKCMLTGISEKFKKQKSYPKEHWLDYAEEKYGKLLVHETKTVVNILVLYLPLPMYWAVYQLQGSRWTFQGTKMNGDLGFYTVKPDQMIALNPIFGIIALAVSDYIIFPLLAKIKITTLLQKMTIGGMLTVVASIVAGLLQIRIEKEYISIFWLIPQYVISSFSENFLYNSHLNFAYNEAPPSMKSVMTSFVFVVIALGNVFVIIVSGTRLFESQAVEYFFFAGILFVFMIIFGVLASRYKPVNQQTIRDLSDKKSDNKY